MTDLDPPRTTVRPVPARYVMGVRIDASSYAETTEAVLTWARQGESRYVTLTNAHGITEAQDDPQFLAVLNGADLTVPDGKPLVFMLRDLGLRHATRVYGPDLMLHVCQAAAAAGIPIALYGSTEERLALLCENLPKVAPGLEIACTISPPFRALTPEEDQADIDRVVASGAKIVFVGLGCPKQERWCAAHKDRLPAVLLGVGAAFDFHAGKLKQAPDFLQDAGLEWAFRLAMEPKRLWSRYSKVVPRFLLGYLQQRLKGVDGTQPPR